MSFDVELLDENQVAVSVERFTEGGTYAIGGITTAELNITYNYSPHYYEHLNSDQGLRWLDGKKAKETITALESAVSTLGVEKDPDYWASTSGNAGYALNILLGWAKQNLDAIWNVS